MFHEYEDDMCPRCKGKLFNAVKSTTKGTWLICVVCGKIFYHKWRSKGLSQCECEG